jgi:hypothetical protein
MLMEELFQSTLMGHILEKHLTIMDIIQIWVVGEEEEEEEVQISMVMDLEEAEEETMMIMGQEEGLETDGVTMITTEGQIEEVLGMMEEDQIEGTGGTEERQLTGTDTKEGMTEEIQFTEEIEFMIETQS